MKTFKKQLKHFLKIKTSNITHNSTILTDLILIIVNFINELQSYEDLNLRNYVQDPSHFVISSEESKDFQMALRHTVENLKNPYIDFYHWCKSELYDIRAVKDTLLTRKTLIQ